MIPENHQVRDLDAEVQAWRAGHAFAQPTSRTRRAQRQGLPVQQGSWDEDDRDVDLAIRGAEHISDPATALRRQAVGWWCTVDEDERATGWPLSIGS